ncbi:MAG: methyltransferase domain-containing protein, partial [Cellulomonadaceae bacterium]|nr:methyltransferase domain-containing protein [Cellulomonadaceae bacterium]
MTTTTTTDPDIALKARHRAMWALGDYPTLAHELIEPLGLDLVRTAGIAPAQRVLDVAAGAGNAALPAARAGADVTAADLTPELLAAGRARAEQEGDTQAIYTRD